MGLIDSLVDGAISFGMEAHNEYINNKIQEETNNTVSRISLEVQRMLDNWTTEAKQIQRNKDQELFQERVKQSFDMITESLCKGNLKQRTDAYLIEHIKNNGSLEKVESFVKEKYDFFLNSDIHPYIEKANRLYSIIFKQLSEKWVESIKARICSKVKKPEYSIKDSVFKGIEFDLLDCIYLLYLLKLITNDEKYQTVINTIDDFKKDNTMLFSMLEEIEYGEFNTDADNWIPENMTIDTVSTKIKEAFEHISDNNTGYFEGITTYLNRSLLIMTSIQLWHYTSLTPFNQWQFDNAVNLRNHFTASKDNNFECILAELYVKNQLGGSALVLQNLDEIMAQADIRNPIYARGICSFLAYMECYDIELEVLKKAVANKIQLTEEMQKRLSFLLEGGKAVSIKVYNVEDTSDFCFDTHSIEWKSAEYEIFFRKLKSSNKRLNYALVTKSWHKPYPIQRGMKFSMDSLEKEFNRLVSDFEGEVILEKNRAYALNVNNMMYSKAYLFKFISERNRGLAVLFQCEKFGRNLQLNILTTFMPDDNMNNDDMLQYALALQNSSYVKSFLESILQAIDSSLTIKNNSIYD